MTNEMRRLSTRQALSLAVILISVFIILATVLSSLSASAQAATTQYVGARILNTAETRVNDPYSWGGAGPYYFDCSGLVDWAATSIGEQNWPRDTYNIAAEIGTRFTITSHPVRGDLAMWGSYGAPYHVEMVTAWNGITFGGETSTWAGRVTWHDNTYWRPDFYLHINY